MDTILIRKDVQGKNVVFFPDTFNKEKNTIQYWDGVHGHQKDETSADYYFTSKPVKDEEVTSVSAAYSGNFGTKQLLIRHRLYKDGTKKLEEAPANLTTPFDKKAFAKKLIAGITKAIEEAVKEAA